MFKDKFVQILQTKGISAYKLSKDTGITQGMISYWKNGERMPSAKNLNILADYFNVTVDYLLGETDEKKSASTDSVDTEADRLFEQVKQLSPEKQEQAFSYLRFLLSEQDNH